MESILTFVEFRASSGFFFEFLFRSLTSADTYITLTEQGHAPFSQWTAVGNLPDDGSISVSIQPIYSRD